MAIDQYFKAPTEQALRDGFFTQGALPDGSTGYVPNVGLSVIGPVQGSAASVGSDGKTIPAKGDPAFWYLFVRAANLIALPANVTATTAYDAIPVCGEVF